MTKLVKEGIPSRFITGDDVIITKGTKHPGQTVDEAIEQVDTELERQQKDIDKLKSNMKYLYSYGGVGGNGRGGSGGDSTGSPILFISLNGRQIQSGTDNIIVLNSPGEYVLEGSLSNNGGKTFFLSVGYGNNTTRPLEFTLDAETRWRISPTILRLTRNGEIVIKLSDTEGPISELHQQYIVNPHTFSAKFMYEYDNGSGTKQYNEFSPYEYFIGNTSQMNPFIEVSFKIDLLNVTHIQVKYDIGDTDSEDTTLSYDAITEENPITVGHGVVSFGSTTNITNNTLKIYLDKLTRNGEKFTTEDNNGTYNIKVKFSYTANGSEVPIPETSFDITLIPNDLYIHVRNSNNMMYDSLEEIKAACDDGIDGIPTKYINIGAYTSFYCKVFEGPMMNEAEHYYLDFNIWDLVVVDEQETFELNQTLNNSDVTEQVETTPPFSVAFQSKGIKKLEFKTLGRKTPGSASTTKYIYVNEPTHQISDWYPQDIEQTSFYFRANLGTNINSDYLRDLRPFEISEKDRPITITDNWTEQDSSKATTIISFGIQYSSVNVDGAKILDVYGTGTTPVITLYSNKLFDITAGGESGKKICIPAEDNFDKSVNSQYHLVQIVRHCIDEKNNAKQYASYLYIDGKLESNKSGIDTNPWRFSRIVFNNVNAVYNLISIQYVRLLPPISSMNTSNKSTTLTIDEVLYQYYLAYKDIMGAGTVSVAEKTIFDNMSSIRFDGTNVIVNYDFVKTVSTDMPIPTMMMEYVPAEGEDPSKIINDLFRGYGTASNDFESKDILIHWANGNGSALEANTLSVPEMTDEDGYVYTGGWKVELQGTSTMRNRIKNFSLVLDSTSSNDGNKKILMSPNYDPDDSSTFLPEQIWTLKADIADSAHANNTSVGKFVNNVCTKFSTSVGLDLPDDIKPYIKNTLEGFPILMYFKVNDDIYYLGVYNFNMGRNSYYNLGYHTKDDMIPMVEKIQASGKDNSPFRYSVGYGVFPDRLAVGEVQDNHAEFDFHQYDETVLFGSGGTMFGANSKITGVGEDKSAAKTTLKNFVRSVARAGAYCFNSIGKTPIPSKKDTRFGDDEDGIDCIKRYSYTSQTSETGDTVFKEYVPDISWQFSIENGTNRWYDPDDPNYPADRERPLTFAELGMDVDNLLQCISDDDKDNIYQENYHFLDFTSVSEYYTICMAFGLVDSVLKNMNIKSWDGKKCCVAFYDMDCAMGENNTGAEDVTYLAASDYWYSPNNNGYIEPVNIHYDYWEETIGKGFDYPSSYLFAIAKYAQAIVDKLLGRTLNRYPQQFWAELRKPELNGQPGGELQNADYFINKYFSSGIGRIPAYMASMNYQVKYMYYGKKTDAEGHESSESSYLANENAFNGSRLEKVKDWLKKRIHFLDFMFNLQGITVDLGGGYSMPLANEQTLALVKQNPDVVILSDAFTDEYQNGARVDSYAQPVAVYAPMNTPFIVARGSKNKMYLLCEGTDKQNIVQINVTRSEPVKFYGSKEFTNMSMVDPFLTTANIISSNNLEEIKYGGMNIPQSTSGLKVVSTSVKNIKLNIPTFSGLLEIASDGLNGQALTSLDISETGFIGNWTNLKKLQKLNISSVKNTNGSIYVAECAIDGDNCVISGKNDENKTDLYSLTLSGIEGDFRLTNTNIEKISFTATKEKDATFEISGDTRLNDLRLTGFKKVVIRGCSSLKTLVIEDHPDTSIQCETIIIDIPEAQASDGPRDILSSFNSNVEGVFDFTGFTNLQKLGLSGCENVIVIKIPNHKVSIDSFKNNKFLEFVDTSGQYSIIELTKDSTFYNCPRYNMRQSWWSEDINRLVPISEYADAAARVGNLTRMCVSPDCTTLAHTFDKLDSTIKSNYLSTPYTNTWGQKVLNREIRNTEACTFINLYIAAADIDDEYIDDENIIHDSSGQGGFPTPRTNCCANIVSLQGCFNKQGSLSYNGSPSMTVPDLSEFTSLTNISMMYYGTGVTFMSASLLSLPDSMNNNDDLHDETGETPSHELSWADFIGNGNLNISRDAFKHISYRITSLSYMTLSIYGTSTSSGDSYRQLVNTDGTYLDFVDVLCPQTDSETGEVLPFERLTGFYNFSINPQQYIDYRNLIKVCPNIRILSGFLYNDLEHSLIDGMLKECTKLESVDMSFCHTGDMEFAPDIDLYEFFNWGDEEHPEESLFNIQNLFTSSANEEIGFAVKKHISLENFQKILNVLHNYKNITRLSNIFSYCTIQGYDPDLCEIKLGNLEEGEKMNKINCINALFYNCKSDNEKPLKIRRSFFECLPNVTLMSNTFGNVEFDHLPTYDFFCKRREVTETQGIYVKIGDNYITSGVELHTIGYGTSLINSMFSCFKGAKFRNCKCWFDLDDGNRDLIPVTDTVTYNGDTYTEYYRREGGNYVKYVIKDPVAYTDTVNNFTNYVPDAHNAEYFTINNHDIDTDLNIFGNKQEGYPYTTNNFNIYPTYCCLPPDIFHACSNNCNLTEVFSNTNIIGVIPQHLVVKCYNGNFTDMLCNVNILPNLIYHYNSQDVDDSDYLALISGIEAVDEEEFVNDSREDTDKIVYKFEEGAEATVLFRNTDGELKRRRPIISAENSDTHTPIDDVTIIDYSKSQFVYVPQGFTTNRILESAFTFRYNLPAQVDLYAAILMRDYGIDWGVSSAGNTYNPDLRPDLWPYYTQYFFTTDESLAWNRIYNISSPFIRDDQDISFEEQSNGTYEQRLFSSNLEGYNNKWWSVREYVDHTIWHNKTNGIFNVFLNLCGQRDVRTGKIKDYGCPISRSLNNAPVLNRFITDTLVILLNGKVFDDSTDGGRLLVNNGNPIINYSVSFSRNLMLPRINTKIDKHPTNLIFIPQSNYRFYEYMFPEGGSISNYYAIYTTLQPKVDTTSPKYRIL